MTSFFLVAGGEFDLHFAPRGQNKGSAAPSRTGGARPRRIQMGSSPLSAHLDKKKQPPYGDCFSYLVAGGGLEPPASGL